MITNIAAYKFVAIDQPEALRAQLHARCAARGLKGSILLSSEGINLFLAGAANDVDALIAHLHADARFSDMSFKHSCSAAIPFRRLLVKVKPAIIPGTGFAMQDAAPRLSAGELKRWLDEGRAVTLIDARNSFEVAFGTFRGARHLQLNNFREFADKTRALAASLGENGAPIVTFCTGGIRCEKAAPLLLAQGLREVYQLDGGILEYFNQCGAAHYDGDCFVFDERVALTPQLRPVSEPSS